MTAITDTQSLLIQLLQSVTRLETKVDAFVDIPSRLSALEKKALEPELLEARFKALEDWQTQWKGGWWLILKVSAVASTIGSGIWALFTWWKH